jgi:hypothetical protein
MQKRSSGVRGLQEFRMHVLTLRRTQKRFLVLHLAFAPELSAPASPELLQFLELLNSFLEVDTGKLEAMLPILSPAG